ncbi:MAG: hypothetical protein M1821_001624 [Bathelium mastoideum]|nr:MAG: hypothetical protein M1821_001624 [Bathelium mastoideum]
MDVVTWATESLGVAGTATLNDFVSPLGLLTATIAFWIGLNDQNPTKSLGSSTLPAFLNSSHANAAPWGNRTVRDTPPWDVPETGVTRSYDFTVRRGVVAPDGVNKSSILVNDQYPGPLVEANWGDWIEVTVHNEIYDPLEGTSLHWHGIPQNGTPWYDGAASVSQCPIAPGSSLTYRFRASVYGTSWWHSHLSAQYSDGLFGPMVVYGPSHVAYDYDVGPVLVHDYYHADYTSILTNVLGKNPLISLLAASDNTLIQSPSNHQCSLTAGNSSPCTPTPGPAKFGFVSGKKHRIRLINPSSVGAPLLFSIDNHTLTIIANDFVPIEPYQVTVVTLAAGQRTDVVVEATGDSGSSYWIRVRQPDLCNNVIQPFALAALYYDGADVNSIPWTTSQPDFLTPRLEQCSNDPIQDTVPVFSIAATGKPDATVTVNMSTAINSQNQTVFEMNGVPFDGSYGDPILAHAISKEKTFEPQWNVFDFTGKQSIRIIFINSQPFNHPMNVHGQQMKVLAVGQGSWNGSIVRPNNPQRRDTQIIPANGYLVAELTGDNPGVWPFHCHKSWHLSPGQMINVLFGREELNAMTLPAEINAGCTGKYMYLITELERMTKLTGS